ncbi:MAG: hypothetical protein LBQ55_03980 [Treponema sp.]|jgi:hypothetical protein|nr:hypothetical protein [Treponema sp.]
MDIIPRKDVEFDAFYKNYIQVVSKYALGTGAIWDHIPSARVTELSDRYAAWFTAWGKVKGPHIHADVVEKDAVKRAGSDTLREFNNEFILYSRKVTDAQIAELRVHRRDPVRTTVPAPRALPEADVRNPGKHLVELVDIRPVPGTEDDPRFNFGVRIFWGLTGPATAADKFRLTAPPLTGDDLPHSTFTHHKQYRFDFEGDSGRTVYFCLRYENEKGGKTGEGPFGAIFETIIT